MVSIVRREGRFRLGSGQFPRLVSAGAGTVVIGDHDGVLRLFDIDTMGVIAEVFVGAMGGMVCSRLRSLSVDPTNTFCAAATMGGYAALWNLDSRDTLELYPKVEGPVNAVCFNPLEPRILLGLGFYPLHDARRSGRPEVARVEIWDTGLSRRPQQDITLPIPGVCVDAMAFSPHGDYAAVVSGFRQQKLGLVTVFDSKLCIVHAYCEIPCVMSRLVSVFEREGRPCILVVGLRSVAIIEHVDGDCHPVVIREFNGTEILGAAVDRHRQLILLTTGLVLDLRGEPREQIDLQPGCADICAMPDGRYAAVFCDGRIECWDISG